VFLRTITDARTPVCLLTAITSVEAVTPPRGEPAALTLAAVAGKSIRPKNLDAVERGETQAARKTPPRAGCLTQACSRVSPRSGCALPGAPKGGRGTIPRPFFKTRRNYKFNLRRKTPTAPTMPVPRSNRLLGSGVCEKSAPRTAGPLACASSHVMPAEFRSMFRSCRRRCTQKGCRE
jgi:hypothetical protein